MDQEPSHIHVHAILKPEDWPVSIRSLVPAQEDAQGHPAQLLAQASTLSDGLKHFRAANNIITHVKATSSAIIWVPFVRNIIRKIGWGALIFEDAPIVPACDYVPDNTRALALLAICGTYRHQVEEHLQGRTKGLPLDAHVLDGVYILDPHASLIPLLVFSDSDDIVPLITSILCHRRTVGLDAPAVVLQLSQNGARTLVLVHIGWMSEPGHKSRTSSPIIHVASPQLSLQLTCGIFDLEDCSSAASFMQYLTRIGSHLASLELPATGTKLDSTIQWRLDSRTFRIQAAQSLCARIRQWRKDVHLACDRETSANCDDLPHGADCSLCLHDYECAASISESEDSDEATLSREEALRVDEQPAAEPKSAHSGPPSSSTWPASTTRTSRTTFMKTTTESDIDSWLHERSAHLTACIVDPERVYLLNEASREWLGLYRTIVDLPDAVAQPLESLAELHTDIFQTAAAVYGNVCFCYSWDNLLYVTLRRHNAPSAVHILTQPVLNMSFNKVAAAVCSSNADAIRDCLFFGRMSWNVTGSIHRYFRKSFGSKHPQAKYYQELRSYSQSHIERMKLLWRNSEDSENVQYIFAQVMRAQKEPLYTTCDTVMAWNTWQFSAADRKGAVDPVHLLLNHGLIRTEATQSDNSMTAKVHEFLIPGIIVQYTRDLDATCDEAQHRCYMCLTAIVQFLAITGVCDYPVFGLAIRGNIGLLSLAVMPKDSTHTHTVTHSHHASVGVFDISNPAGVLHLQTTLLRIKEYHKTCDGMLQEAKNRLLEDGTCAALRQWTAQSRASEIAAMAEKVKQALIEKHPFMRSEVMSMGGGQSHGAI